VAADGSLHHRDTRCPDRSSSALFCQAAANTSPHGVTPTSPADGATNFEFHKRLAQTAERGLFDAYFLADSLSVGLGGREGGNAKIAGFEPVTLFSALAPADQ
jgi:alkanesulfonate monooxygenase SsuD/methylene tetrahydromethanopterin reductase-like flavin-dependent oxidoreductase (luciferase family)